MQQCEGVVFFQSATALASPNCFSEIRTAHRQGKPLLVLPLDDAAPEGEWTELLERAEYINGGGTAEDRAGAILRSKLVKRRFRRTWREKIPGRAVGLVISLLFFLAAAGAFGALATGRWTPVPEVEPPAPTVTTPAPTATPAPVVELGGAERYFAVTFPDSQQEKAVRQALDIPEESIQRWNLSEIRELAFCGNMVLKSTAGVSFDSDGACRVNGAPVIAGKVKDLSLFADMLRLERLALIRQPVTDLSALNGLTLLRELDLSGSDVTDLSSLRETPALETLRLEHTNLRDLTPLAELPGLRTVTVSRDMLPLRWSGGAGFDVVLAETTER